MAERFLNNILRKLIYGARGAEPHDRFGKARYKRIWISSVLVTATVSIVPLIVMMSFNYFQYRKALKEESIQPIRNLVSTSRRSLEYSLEERKNALVYITKANPVEELADRDKLKIIKKNLDESFAHFVDLGLVDSSGNLVSYVANSELETKLRGVNYSKELWFNEVLEKGVFISDVFMGYRGKPHFVIAVRTGDSRSNIFILRSAIDMQLLTDQIPVFGRDESSDAFIVNREGKVQTRSQSEARASCDGSFGCHISTARRAREKAIEIPASRASNYPEDIKVIEVDEKTGAHYAIGYANINNTPFIYGMSHRMPDLMRTWLSLRKSLVGFLIGSILVILALTMTVSSVLVSRIRDADVKHDQAIHQSEYSAKMASIGRLASGVAHEINNPLAIINEKAGLLHDLVSASEEFPNREKSLKIAESIIASVERGSVITHRLLGFARHFEVKNETIVLAALVNEVLGFLEKEAAYRNIEVIQRVRENMPVIQSDRGQLQQVFLNIINNAFAAVGNKGKVEIDIERKEAEKVSVTISDDGDGIDEKDLDRIFEPFFSTKEHGTGLGLSITYGIVKKLKGEIAVESKKGRGSIFTVTLPLKTE